MNDNNSIINITNAANRFCKTYRDFGDSINEIGAQIADLEEKSTKMMNDYQLDKDLSAKITAEELYAGLSDQEKYVDEKGNILPWEMLTDDEIQSLEARAEAQSKVDFRADAKIDTAKMLIEIEKKEILLDKLITQNINLLSRAYDNFKNEQERLAVEKTQLMLNINSCELDKEKVKLDPTISNKQSLINDYRKNIALYEAKILVNNCVNRVAKLYNIIFRDIKNNISNDMFEQENYVDNVNRFASELDIVESISNLVGKFRKFKTNYDSDLEKISEIEESISKYKDNYADSKGVTQFVKLANESTKELRETIKAIEENKDLEKVNDNELSKIDEFNTSQNNQQATTENKEQNENNQQPTAENKEQNENNQPITGNKEQNENNQQPIVSTQQPTNSIEELDLDANSSSINKDSNYLNDPIYKVNRNRVGRCAFINGITNVSATTLLAASALGFTVLPSVATIGVIGGLAFNAYEFASTAINKAAITHHLKKIAKTIAKENPELGFKLGEPDYEKGTINFVMVDGDEKVNVNSTNIDPVLYNRITMMLNNKFHNEDRELGSRKAVTIRQADLHELPKVTIDNLQAAYATVGGVETLRETIDYINSSWSTSAKKVATVKDKIASNINEIKNKFKPVSIDEVDNLDEDIYREDNAEEEVIVGPNVIEEGNSSVPESPENAVVEPIDEPIAEPIDEPIDEDEMDATKLVSHLGEHGEVLSDANIAEFLDILSSDEADLEELPDDEIGRTLR